MSLHRCTDADCPHVGQRTDRGCLCHKTDEQVLTEQRDELLRLVEAVVCEWDEYADGNEWPSADDAVRIMDALWRQDFFTSARAAIANATPGESHD
jgi:hypothetical protein